MSKFKVGDKVRTLYDCGSSVKGSVYTIAECWYNSITEKWYISLWEHLSKSPKHSHYADSYELVEPNPVLTPKEVFEHLRKGTKLQYRRTASSKWVESNLDNPSVKMIILGEWRIKPEPEIIELNGKKYREIVE